MAACASTKATRSTTLCCHHEQFPQRVSPTPPAYNRLLPSWSHCRPLSCVASTRPKQDIRIS